MLAKFVQQGRCGGMNEVQVEGTLCFFHLWCCCRYVLYCFFWPAPCAFRRVTTLRLTRLPRHDRGPVPGGNRSAASCLCTVLRRALYHYATRSPDMCFIGKFFLLCEKEFRVMHDLNFFLVSGVARFLCRKIVEIKKDHNTLLFFCLDPVGARTSSSLCYPFKPSSILC